MIKVGAKYGMICGVFLIIVFHVSYFLGVNPFVNLSHLIFDLMIFGLFIFFASKEFKTFQEDGSFHFWHGMTIGFNTYILATIIFGLYLMLYFQLSESVIADYQEAARSFLMDKKDFYIEQKGQEMFDAQVQAIDQVTKRELISMSVFKKIGTGLFITPVISIILRKQRK